MTLCRVAQAFENLPLNEGKWPVRNPADIEHEKKWGGYNHAPPNFQRCDPNEFWHWFSSSGFYADREHRQFVIPDEPSPEPMRITTGPKPMSTVHLFYGAGETGYGMVCRYEYDKSSPVGYRYEIDTYKFYLCDHQIEHVATVANCLSRYRCSKCGWTYEVDSSGDPS